MRRQFRQDLLPTSWNPENKKNDFCGKTFGGWVVLTQRYYNVNCLQLEEWGFNSGTLARWRLGRQKRKPRISVIVKFCDGIRSISSKHPEIEMLIIEAEQHMNA